MFIFFPSHFKAPLCLFFVALLGSFFCFCVCACFRFYFLLFSFICLSSRAREQDLQLLGSPKPAESREGSVRRSQ